MINISYFLKTDLSGSVKLGVGSILYVDDISEQAREYLNKNNAVFNTNKNGQLLIELPKDTVLVPVMTQTTGKITGVSTSIYILPDNSMLESVVLNSMNVIKVLLAAL